MSHRLLLVSKTKYTETQRIALEKVKRKNTVLITKSHLFFIYFRLLRAVNSKHSLWVSAGGEEAARCKPSPLLAACGEQRGRSRAEPTEELSLRVLAAQGWYCFSTTSLDRGEEGEEGQ